MNALTNPRRKHQPMLKVIDHHGWWIAGIGIALIMIMS